MHEVEGSDHVAGLIASISKKRRADLEAARHVYTLMTTTEADYGQVNSALIKAGLSPFSQPWYSRLKTTYETWVVQRGFTEEQLEGIGLTKLYLMRNTAEDQSQEWLAMASVYTDAELTKLLKDAEREKPLQEPFVSIRVPESVKEQLEGALLNVRNSVKSNMSMTQFLERAAVFFAESSSDFVSKIMAALEGRDA